MQLVDMRKQFQGLQGIINQEIKRYLTQDEAFIFIGKTGTTAKILHREGNGLTMLPGVKPDALKDVHVDERAIERMKAIILSMTPEERDNPDIIGASRKVRIAKGSGMRVEDVNKLLKQFDQTKKMMKQFSSGASPFGKLGGKMMSKKMKSKKKKKKK